MTTARGEVIQLAKMGTDASEHAGVQIRVWVPETVYDLLVERAHDRGTNRAEEARQLILAGLRAESVDAQDRDHLERLTWLAALESAVHFELMRPFIEGQPGGGNTPEERQATYQKRLDQARGRAVDRLTKALRSDDQESQKEGRRDHGK